jgi:Uma2 family endonuclease
MDDRGAAITDKLHTGEELLAMGDIGPCELIDGRIVRMSPTNDRHGSIEAVLARELGAFVKRADLGRVLVGEVGIYTRRDPDRVRGADAAFVSYGKMPEGLRGRFLDVAPELVVEVISPTDTWSAMREKIDDYFSIGAERVWILEPDARAVWVYQSASESTRLGDGDTLRGEGVLRGFEVSVRELFEE